MDVVREFQEQRQESGLNSSEDRTCEQPIPNPEALGQFFKFSLDLLCIAGLDGYFKHLNPAWERILGHTATELLSCPFIEFVHPDDRDATLAEVAKLSAGRNTIAFENRYRCANGAYRWLSWRATPLPEKQLIYAVARDITPQKEAEAALQKLQRKTITILESINDAVFTLDSEWQFTYLNSRAEQILGCGTNEIIGECIWQVFPEMVGSTFEREYRRARSQHLSARFEAFEPKLELWFEVRVYPYEDGISVYFRDVTSRKQTESAMLERSRLSALEAEVGVTLAQGGRLPSILQRCLDSVTRQMDGSLAAVWQLNSATNLLQLVSVAGFLSLDALPKRLNPDSTVGRVAETDQPHLANKIPNDFALEESLRSQLGEIHAFAAYPLVIDEHSLGAMVLCSRQPLTDAACSTLSWVSTAIAIALDRAWAREALLSKRETLLYRLSNQIRTSLDLNTILSTAVNEIRSLLQIHRCYVLWYSQSTPPSLAVTHEAKDADLPSLLETFPLRRANILGEKICNQEVICIDDVRQQSALDEATRSLLTDLGITAQLLLPLKTRNNQLGAVVCSYCEGPRPWSDDEVQLLQVVVEQLAIAIDQADLYAQSRSAALAAQTQAHQLSSTLQDLQQTQSQLIQTEKMSSLGEMVAGVAHEINNPVNFISGNLTHASDYTEDLLDLLHLYQKHYPNPDPEIQTHADAVELDFLTEDLPKVLSSMQVGAQRIRKIVLSLRNFSRLDESEKKPVDIHEGLENTLMILQHRLKPSAKSGGITVEKEYSDLPMVECYAGQLNQVFMNILSNAIDALEEQTAPRIITIRTGMGCPLKPDRCEITPSMRCVLIRIQDNGPGMTEAVRKRLFEPFFTTKPAGKGTGLGLSISYRIVVEKHAGAMQCLSEPGQGSEFWIQIPLTTD